MTDKLPPLNQRYLEYLQQTYEFSPFQQRLIALSGESPSHWLLSLTGIAPKYRKYRRLRQIGMRGVPVTAYLIQANSMLFRPGSGSLPCLVLFTFDAERNTASDYMEKLASWVFGFKETQQADPDLRYVVHLTTDERAFHYRRRMLPPRFTEEIPMYVADLWIDRRCLPLGYLTDRRLPCLAEPGESGGLELLPWWVLSDT